MNSTVFYTIMDMISHMKITDIIDILIVAYAFYKIYEIIKQTRAEQLVRGILILVFALFISEIAGLYMVNWILKNTMTVGLVAILVVFQPELRRILENLGRSKFFKNNNHTNDMTKLLAIEEAASATFAMSIDKIGALIVFENQTGLNEIIQTGTLLEAKLSRGLLINIFVPNTPLHDGAVVVRGNKIMAAGCFLPLTENKTLSKELGTRHRAAIGISEKSDAIILIVSEETGSVSISIDGKLYRNLNYEEVVLKLSEHLIQKPSPPIINNFMKGEKDDEK